MKCDKKLLRSDKEQTITVDSVCNWWTLHATNCIRILLLITSIVFSAVLSTYNAILSLTEYRNIIRTALNMMLVIRSNVLIQYLDCICIFSTSYINAENKTREYRWKQNYREYCEYTRKLKKIEYLSGYSVYKKWKFTIYKVNMYLNMHIRDFPSFQFWFDLILLYLILLYLIYMCLISKLLYYILISQIMI